MHWFVTTSREKVERNDQFLFLEIIGDGHLSYSFFTIHRARCVITIHLNFQCPAKNGVDIVCPGVRQHRSLAITKVTESFSSPDLIFNIMMLSPSILDEN